jgi:hypothetical protein
MHGDESASTPTSSIQQLIFNLFSTVTFLVTFFLNQIAAKNRSRGRDGPDRR